MSWERTIEEQAAFASHTVLSGNTADLVITDTEGQTRALGFADAVEEVLRRSGCLEIFVAHPTHGIWLVDDGGVADRATPLPQVLAGLPVHELAPVVFPQCAPTVDELREVLEAVAESDHAIGIIIVDVERWITDPANLQPAEHALFSSAVSLARDSLPRIGSGERSGERHVHSQFVWTTRRDTEIPDFLLRETAVRHLPAERPSFADRGRLATAVTGNADVGMQIAVETDRLTAREVLAVAEIVAQRGGSDVDSAVTLVRLGVTTDPWRDPELVRKVVKGRDALSSRILGQPVAIDTVFDLLPPALAGIAGSQFGRTGRLPRAVLFLAGPTGVGKTELCKALAELLFGNDRSMTRFDMSNFAEAHAAATLVGAPPGYVGHESGGVLTNAVRENPFQVILFDEIEKAHPQIWDKFLQVLSEGHLDDQHGRRAFFDKTVLVFTTNLGVTETHASGTQSRVRAAVTPEMTYEQIAAKLREGIRQYFFDIARPEILGRIGMQRGIIVFDFIRPETALEIARQMVNRVITCFGEEHGTEVSFAPDVLDRVVAHCAEDVTLGARPIADSVASVVSTPLAFWWMHRLAGGKSTEVSVEGRIVADDDTGLTLQFEEVSQ